MLRVYYYDNQDADPQKVLEYPTEITRFGDNISVNVDENGNGYAYFVQQDPGEKILRFEVTNFTTFNAEPEIMNVPMGEAPVSMKYYANYNQVGDANEYLLTSTVAGIIQLVDKDGTVLTEVSKLEHEEGFGDATHGTDAHIINYNNGRYMIMTSGRQQSSWAYPSLFVYDITEGFNTVAALVNFKNTSPNPVYSYQMGESSASGGCAGIAAWAIVDGKLCIFAAAPRSGFTLIEFPKNQK
jgi:hypothetical protein